MKKVITLVMTICMLAGVCSCRRRVQETSESTTDTLPASSSYVDNGEDYTVPSDDEVPVEVLATATSYTGTFNSEATVPSGSSSTPHQTYSVDEITKALTDIANISTGTEYSVFSQKCLTYCDKLPFLGVDVIIPDTQPPTEGHPHPFELVGGSYVKVTMVLYDEETVDGLYSYMTDYYEQVFGEVITQDWSYEYNGELLKYVAGSPNSSVWGSKCYMAVESYARERFGADSYYVTVCVPITNK